jgi:hypothetical protein
MVTAKHLLQLQHVSKPHELQLGARNTYEINMTWLRQGTTLEWTALQYYMYKKCLSTFIYGSQCQWLRVMSIRMCHPPPLSLSMLVVTVGLTFGVASL